MDFVFCFVFGLIIFLMNRSLSFLFFLFFFFYFSDFIWFMWKKRSNGNGENERMRGKKNPNERERIDKISSWYNILIQEIQLLMYSSSSNLMSYCSLAKKKKKKSFRESAGAWTVDILSISSLYFAYAQAVGDALLQVYHTAILILSIHGVISVLKWLTRILQDRNDFFKGLVNICL